MNRLSLLMWLAIIVAVLPLLAIPAWLMKTAVIATALVMAGTTYSLIHQADSSRTSASTTQKHISPGFHPQTVSVEADETTDVKAQSNQSTRENSQKKSNSQSFQETEELTEDELKRQFFNTRNKPKSGQENTENDQTEDSGPVNVTDPNSDRFIAVNTYKSRSERFRS